MTASFIFVAVLGGLHVLVTWILATWRGMAARATRCMTNPGQTDWPSVSIIIPAWQEAGILEQCIASLRSVEYPQWEAIVVAGGVDGTLDKARKVCEGLTQFRVIEQQPRGKNAALNTGLQAARGSVIVLLDADSRVSPGWLLGLVSPLHGSIRATTGTALPLRLTAVSRAERMEWMAASAIRGRVTLQGSASIALQRDLISELGGFPEEVPVGVDWDLDARLAARGVHRLVCQDAVLYTERPATLAEYWRNELRWRRAHLASLFRLPRYFLGDVRSIIQNLYLYGLSWFTICFSCGLMLMALPWAANVRVDVFLFWFLFIGWLAFRRAALALEVAAYTGQAGWLRDLWAPPLLLSVTIAASCVACLSIRAVSMDFKGPRGIVDEAPSL